MEFVRESYKNRVTLKSPYIRNKIKAQQTTLQRPDGLPVFLKGKGDVRLYRGVMVCSVFGLGIAFFTIYRMATGQIKKKED